MLAQLELNMNMEGWLLPFLPLAGSAQGLWCPEPCASRDALCAGRGKAVQEASITGEKIYIQYIYIYHICNIIH